MSDELRVRRIEPTVRIEGPLGAVRLDGLSLSLDEARNLRDRLDEVLRDARDVAVPVCGFRWWTHLDSRGVVNLSDHLLVSCALPAGHTGQHQSRRSGDPHALVFVHPNP